MRETCRRTRPPKKPWPDCRVAGTAIVVFGFGREHAAGQDSGMALHTPETERAPRRRWHPNSETSTSTSSCAPHHQEAIVRSAASPKDIGRVLTRPRKGCRRGLPNRSRRNLPWQRASATSHVIWPRTRNGNARERPPIWPAKPTIYAEHAAGGYRAAPVIACADRRGTEAGKSAGPGQD